MRIEELKIMKSVLGRELGWSWPLFLAGCGIRQRAIFRHTHWANLKTKESQFTRRLSISAAIYLNLMNKYGKERAFEIVRDLLVPIGLNEQLNNLNVLALSDKIERNR